MTAMDGLNRRLGRERVRVAATGIRRSWGMRQERRSPAYTTSWQELFEVKLDGE